MKWTSEVGVADLAAGAKKSRLRVIYWKTDFDSSEEPLPKKA